jgi:hypothetical protein
MLHRVQLKMDANVLRGCSGTKIRDTSLFSRDRSFFHNERNYEEMNIVPSVLFQDNRRDLALIHAVSTFSVLLLM